MVEEYISRKDAMEYLFRAINADPDGNCPNCVHDEHECQYDRCWTLMDFCEKIEYLGYVPAADVVPVRHGRWVKARGSWVTPGGDPVWECSECGKGVHVYGIEHGTYGKDVANGQWVACPNCGAKMDGEV